MLRRRGGRILLSLMVLVPLLGVAVFLASVTLTPLPRPETAQATEILDAAGRRITLMFTENRVEIPVTDMPNYLLDAVVAVEDDRFYQHHGIDPQGVARALYRNVRAGRIVEGGSTLTQQLAKNLYLTHARTLTRKAREAVLTVKLETAYSKKELLGMYWNTIYLGEGAYGVEVASQTYFGKPARQLTLAEAALLAGLPRSPEYYNPRKNPDAAVDRRNLVLDKMVGQGMITAAQAAAAKQEPLKLSAEGGTAVRSEVAPYFVDYVVRELKQRYPDIAATLRDGGYQVYTTLDLDMQRAANQAAASAPAGPEVALVAIEPNTGHIKALVGGRSERVDLNRALERQQPGSAFKPFVYSAVLETRSYTVLSTQVDKRVSFPGAVPGQEWRPENFEKKYSNQPTGMREALHKSLNTVTAQWMDTIKPPAVIDLAKRMGIESKLESNLTLGLGTSEVTPLELTRAYAPFANGGFAVKPMAVLRVTDRSGMVLAEESPERSQALHPGIAFIMTDVLKGVLGPGGTAAGTSDMIGRRPAAGKSGTTDESRDAWFVGYTPDLVSAVWLGYDDNRQTGLLGGATVSPIWARFVSKALQGKKFRDWAPPPDVVAADICTLTGLLPNASCPVGHEWFLAGTEPKEVDPTVHWDRVLPNLPGEAPGPEAAPLPGTPYGAPGTGGAAPSPITPAPAPTPGPFPFLPRLPFPIRP